VPPSGSPPASRGAPAADPPAPLDPPWPPPDDEEPAAPAVARSSLEDVQPLSMEEDARKTRNVRSVSFEVVMAGSHASNGHATDISHAAMDLETGNSDSLVVGWHTPG
jgi:hypothetical protein